MEANKSELGRLYLSRRENLEQAIKLQNVIDAAKSSIVTLEARRVIARSAAELSDDKAKKAEEQLGFMKDRLRAMQSALDSLRVTHGDCIGKDERIAQLTDELDSS